MSRPKKFDDLITRTISVEKRLWDNIIERGLNASEICRDALADRCGVEISKEKKENKFKVIPPDLIKKVRARIHEDKGFAYGCSLIVNKVCDTNFTSKDMIELYKMQKR